MKRLVAIGLAFLAGCAGVSGESGPADSATERAVAIYSTVLRRLTTTSDNTFGEDHEFPVIYVLDRAFPNAGNPDEDTGGEPISEEVRDGILAALVDLNVEFVSDRDSVIGPESDGSIVENDGALATLGTLPEGDQKVEIGASLYIGNLAATWLTYVVENQEGDWTVTGTTGPVSIS